MDCGCEFVFTVKEQEFYQEKDFVILQSAVKLAAAIEKMKIRTIKGLFLPKNYMIHFVANADVKLRFLFSQQAIDLCIAGNVSVR